MMDWTSLPDEVFVTLLENCNFEAILSLRKVCTHFRNFIDDTPQLQKTSLDWLVLNVNPESVKITLTNVGALFHEQCGIDYLKSEEGCLVAWKEHWQWRTKIIRKEDWVTVALRDLEVYLRLLGRSILPHLSIHYYFHHEENEFREGFHRILKSHTLRVEDLDLNISNAEQLLQILPYMTPGVLRQVTVARQQMTEFQVDPVLDMDKLMALEQVRKLEELRIRGFKLSKPIREFYYPARVVLQVKEVTLMEILELREDFNRYPHLKRFVFDCDKMYSYEGSWLQEFGPLYEDTPEEGYNRRRWFFRGPIELEFSQNMIIFTRISTTPKNAIIIE